METTLFLGDFFEELGFKVLLSPSTNKEIVEMGVKVADPETCFSNKVYWGHLLWLDGKCDLIFVPRLKAVAEHSFISHPRFARVTEEKLEYCPKFFALPDLSEILVKTPILTETFDERKENFKKTLQRLGKKLKKNKEETKRAFETASLKEKELKQKEEKDFLEKIKSQKPKIVLISHPNFEEIDGRIYVNKEKLSAQQIGLLLLNYKYPKRIPRQELINMVKCHGFSKNAASVIVTRLQKLVDDDGSGNLRLRGLGRKKAELIISTWCD